jgi:hypothetical protein
VPSLATLATSPKKSRFFVSAVTGEGMEDAEAGNRSKTAFNLSFYLLSG